jgi:hypothetical protein
MKINDFIFRFRVKFRMNHDGICRVRTFIGKESKIFVLLTELEKNPGLSLTNAIEHICQLLIEKGLARKDYVFIEHYEKSLFRSSTFNIVSLDENWWPSWKSLDQNKAQELLEVNPSELELAISCDKNLEAEIEKICTEIDPFADFSATERPDVIKRRFKIESGMIRKDSLAGLIQNSATEQEIQRLLKSDLSIFGEVYAHPEDEYIVFSEFPVADGAVDFAVFSGRSRMDITLIEVKEANFSLVNQGHYDKFSSKIEEAADQIRNRLRHVYENIRQFRNDVHTLRQRVEQGERIYNSFLGPYKDLHVDPEKDVDIRCVVIGGRTRDDLAESKKRSDFERNFTIPLKIDSWDSWLKKLRRS